MKEIKKIDIHAHATMYPGAAPKHYASGYSLCSAEEVIGFYDKLGIEKGVLLPLVSPEDQPEPVTSNECRVMAERHPDRFIWFCNVDPRTGFNSPKGDLSYYLGHYKALGAKGVGELTANLPADDPLMDNLFYHCAECDMPVTIHIAPMKEKYGFYGIKDDVGLPRLEKMLKKHKNLKIFGHSQAFWAEISADVTEESRTGYPTGKVTEGRIAKLLREYPNLYCDFSATSGMTSMMRDPDYAARFFEEFSDRVMYGCDICATFNTHPFAFKDWLDKFRSDGYISEENYYKFVRGNAIRLLKL